MILPEEEGSMANYMKSPSETRMRVVMGMSMCAFCISLRRKVNISAYSLSSTLFHSHLKTLLSFISLQIPFAFFFRVVISHCRESSGKKMQLELVVNTTSFAELMDMSPSFLSLLQVFLRDNPVEKQDITSLAPSCMTTQVICDGLLSVFFKEMSPMERVPVLERGCRKIVATRCPDSLFAKSCERRLDDYSLGLKAMAPSVMPFTPYDNLSAFIIEEFFIVIRSFSGVRKRLKPSKRVSSLVFLESFAQNSAYQTFCSSPAIRSEEPTRATS